MEILNNLCLSEDEISNLLNLYTINNNFILDFK